MLVNLIVLISVFVLIAADELSIAIGVLLVQLMRVW